MEILPDLHVQTLSGSQCRSMEEVRFKIKSASEAGASALLIVSGDRAGGTTSSGGGDRGGGGGGSGGKGGGGRRSGGGAFYLDSLSLLREAHSMREAGEIDEDLRASRAMAGVARGAAVPAGRTLTRAEMRDVVDGLFACQEPDRDPWGRPTIATFDREAVASWFR